MIMKLDQVVPLGRSQREYFAMFGLTPGSLQQRILGCADGPASFNAEMTAQGGQVVSCDPLYQFSGAEIQQRFEATVDRVIDQVKVTPDAWVWKFHRDADDLKYNRTQVLHRFLADYDRGKAVGRYITAELPHLPFTDRSFDLALCSHFLFLYSDLFSTSFHQAAVQELCRVAIDVRIFPLLTLAQIRSPHIDSVRQMASTLGYESEICPVEYELQPGGNQMLRLVKS